MIDQAFEREMMEESRELRVAKQAALQAAEIIRAANRQGQAEWTKASAVDLATEVDVASQAEILELLETGFPSYDILAEEEDARVDQGSEFKWVVDPLDGTAAFKRGVPKFCVAIGLLKKGQPYLGVVCDVAASDLYWAEQGRGAFKNGQPIHVSSIAELSKAWIGSDYQNTRKQRLADNTRNGLISAELMPSKFRTGDPSVFSLTRLADGSELDGFIHVCRAWDFAAGAALIQEAGGRVTNWQGRSIDWSKDWIEGLFSNGLIHDQLVAGLRTLPPS